MTAAAGKCATSKHSCVCNTDCVCASEKSYWTNIAKHILASIVYFSAFQVLALRDLLLATSFLSEANFPLAGQYWFSRSRLWGWALQGRHCWYHTMLFCFEAFWGWALQEFVIQSLWDVFKVWIRVSIVLQFVCHHFSRLIIQCYARRMINDLLHRSAISHWSFEGVNYREV